jgi:HSP20 family protein
MLVHWSPLGEMSRFSQDLNRFFDDTFAAKPARRSDTVQSLWTPAVDVVEDADKIEIRADLPGVRQEDLDIQIQKEVLTLRGQRQVAAKAEGHRYARSERVFGAFVRSFALPPTVDGEKIGAELKDGVLTLTLPKRPEAQPRQIRVSVAQ